MKKLNFLVAFVIATFATSQIYAQAGSSAPTTVCLPANQDAMIHEWTSTTNYGSSNVLLANRWTYTSSGGSEFYTVKLLNKFDLTSLPSGAIVSSATMKLHVDVTAAPYHQHRDLGGGTGNGATIEQVGSAWNESTVTWNTAPSISGLSTTISSLGDLSTADVVVNVTLMVQNMISTGVNNGFQLSMTDNSDYYHSLVFGSRENNSANGIYRPELCVTYTTPCVDWSLCGNTIIPTDFLGSLNYEALNFKTNNTQRMTLGADGNLGLGIIPSSNAAFHILTGSNPGMLPPKFIFERNDGTNQAGIFSLTISNNTWPTFASTVGGGSACFKLEDPSVNSQNSDMVFSTNAIAPQFIIKHSGNVGIGTTGPTANFHSVGTARLESLPVSSTNTDIITTDANGNLSTQSASTLFSGSAWNLLGNVGTNPTADFIGTTDAQPLNFRTNGTQQLTIDTNGNIGAGTTTPLHKLHVNDGALMLSGAVPGFGGPQLLFSDNVTTHPNGRWALEYITATATRPSMGGLNFWTPFNPGGGSGTAGNYSLFLKDDGKISMGATDDSGDANFCASALPNGYKLYVNGGILTTKVKVANYCSSAWADFVFANDYKLKPLSEVEKFIKENKHLPNVPSALEIEKEGLDLADMQSKQMEKIEELTLYLIEMKKEIEILKNQNAVLSSQITKK